MGKKEDKTNVMRVFDSKKIKYNFSTYDNTLLNADKICEALGVEKGRLFKTLVTVAASKKYYVFMVPAVEELDLKKAAKAAGEKSISMLPQKELLPLTGYIHGGCSPVGMKKVFPTFIDDSALKYETVFFSGGKVGHQVETSLDELEKVIAVKPFNITK